LTFITLTDWLGSDLDHNLFRHLDDLCTFFFTCTFQTVAVEMRFRCSAWPVLSLPPTIHARQLNRLAVFFPFPYEFRLFLRFSSPAREKITNAFHTTDRPTLFTLLTKYLTQYSRLHFCTARNVLTAYSSLFFSFFFFS